MSKYRNFGRVGPRYWIRRGVIIGSAIFGAVVSKKRGQGALIGGGLGLLGVLVHREYENAQARKMFGPCVDRTYREDNPEECGINEVRG